MNQETIGYIVQLINGVGFPIVACLALGWYIIWTRKNNQEIHSNREKNNNDTLKFMAETINNNTEAINNLVNTLLRKDI